MDDEPLDSGTVFFGEPWDAPQTDGARRVPTPVGEQCLMCPDLIAEDDQGLMVGHFTGTPVEPKYLVHPAHRECMIAGVLSHEAGVCHCQAPDMPLRERGRRTLAWLAGQRNHRDGVALSAE